MTAEPIVFIPGFMCDARAFLPQMVQLGATHACQVILPSGEETVERLAPHVTILPEVTPINLNTASAEVLAATLEGVETGLARQLVATYCD